MGSFSADTFIRMNKVAHKHFRFAVKSLTAKILRSEIVYLPDSEYYGHLMVQQAQEYDRVCILIFGDGPNLSIWY